MAVNLSWEGTVRIFHSSSPKSYKIPAIVFSLCETKSDYHACNNSCKTLIGENFQIHPESKNIINKYFMAVLKDIRVVGYLNKGKSGRYAETIFYFLSAYQSNSAVVTVKGKRTNYGDRQGLHIPCKIKFKEEAKCFKILQEQLNLYS